MRQYKRKPALSIVVPVRNEADNIISLVAEIDAALRDRLDFEIVFVNDGSTDATEAKLRDLMVSQSWVRQIKHTSAHGQSAAIRTGVVHAQAQMIVTIDGDGQNDPAAISNLMDAQETGTARVGLIAGQRVRRHASHLKRLQSRIANAVRNFVLHDGASDSGCGLKLFRRDLFLTLPYFDGQHRFMPALVRHQGYDVSYVDVADRPRLSGSSNYTGWNRLWIGILDLAGVWWLTYGSKQKPQAWEVFVDDR